MCDDTFDDDENDLNLISKEWERVAARRHKDGFKEGYSRGQEVTMQEGFDEGFRQGFACSILMSKIRGVITALKELHQHYEGSPITPPIMLEAEMIIDQIDDLETNNLIQDVVEMDIGGSSTRGGGCGGACSCENDDEHEVMQVSRVQLNNNKNRQHASKSGCAGAKERSCNGSYEEELTRENKLGADAMEQLIASDPRVRSILVRCNSVFSKLGWHDEISNILSS